MALTRKQRDDIVAKARALAATTFHKSDLSDGCLILSWAVCVIASRMHGHKLVVRAGSAYWPRLNAATDDGVSPDRFGYEWEPGSANTSLRIAMRQFPELHVWAYDSENSAIIDLTTRSWPAQCKALIDHDWPGDVPPDFWWGPADKLPELAHYRASNSAAQIAERFLQLALMEAMTDS